MSSLTLDFTAMIDQAYTLINGLWPVFVIPIGFTLGLGLLNWIVKSVRDSVKM